MGHRNDGPQAGRKIQTQEMPSSVHQFRCDKCYEILQSEKSKCHMVDILGLADRTPEYTILHAHTHTHTLIELDKV